MNDQCFLFEEVKVGAKLMRSLCFGERIYVMCVYACVCERGRERERDIVSARINTNLNNIILLLLLITIIIIIMIIILIITIPGIVSVVVLCSLAILNLSAFHSIGFSLMASYKD